MTVTKEFLEFAQGCPYCEGNPEAGAVCHHSGEAAFTCEIENCPLFQQKCPAFSPHTHHCSAFAAECPCGGLDSPDCFLNKLA